MKQAFKKVKFENDKCSRTVSVMNGYLVTISLSMYMKLPNRTEIMETF